MPIPQRLISFCACLLFWLAACSSGAATSPAPRSADQPLRVVATTTLVGDVVRSVSGDAVDLTVLLPPGIDPHSFQPTPKEVARISNADVIFTNGLGLEKILEPFLENASPNARIVAVSDGVPLIQSAPAADPASADDHGRSGADPHVWWDPNNVVIWADNIAKTLTEADPPNQALYQDNARLYQKTLSNLDQWVRAQVDQVPPGNRKLVTDHNEFGYLAKRYGFDQVGAVLPGFSTLASPSAQDLASLEDTIRKLGVKAVFVGNTVNPDLARQVAEDTGVQLVTLYTDSLTPAGGPADSYESYIRYNIGLITQALK